MAATATKRKPAARKSTTTGRKPGAARKSPAAAAKKKTAAAAKKKNDNLAKAREAAAAKREAKKKEEAKEIAARQRELRGEWKVEGPQFAQEINVRYEKAHKLDVDADDHRVAAALQLVKVSDKLKEMRKAKIASTPTFEQWVKKNLHEPDDPKLAMSYSKATKLLMIGRAPDPLEKIQAMRDGNREHMAKARKTIADKSGANGKRKPKSDPWTVAEETAAALDDKGQQALAEKLADEQDAVVVSRDEYKSLKETAAKPAKKTVAKDDVTDLEFAKSTFNDLNKADRLKLLQHAATMCGFKVEKLTDDDPLEIPASLDRRKKAPAARKKAA